MVEKINDRCCGCGACENVCPVRAIRYIADADGFYKPVVDESRCIHCGLCLKKCPLEKTTKGNTPQEVYACRNTDSEALFQSSSGGVFAALAEKVVSEGGCVFGCGWSGLTAKHIEAQNATELPKLFKSKYVQSDMGGVHKQIANRLAEGKKVLFCGTPCQVAGLKTALGDKNINLVTVDFICHGVPSSKVFRQYIYDLECTNESAVADVCFRDKTYGWNKLQISIRFKNGKIYTSPAARDSYYKAFLCNLSLNKCCGNCKFNSIPRVADITLGDFWNIENYYCQLDDNKGASCVVVNSDTGVQEFDLIKKKLQLIPSSVTQIMDGNPFLNGHCKLHQRRKAFFAGLENEKFSDLVSRCLKPTLWERLIEIARYKLRVK